MKLVLGSRKSPLARIQAYQVGSSLKKMNPCLQIEYFFKESLGDQNANIPLWQFPEKGAFTQDLVKMLEDGSLDLVVHSWKDLPIEERTLTEVRATLKRAEPRDFLLVRKNYDFKSPLKILCSSPRRIYNLTKFLSWALPQPCPSFSFETVRGNVQTRLSKLLDEKQGDALVIAGAALQRLIEIDNLKDELDLHNEYSTFSIQAELLKKQLSQCRVMVLAMSENPWAAAQGALAIETRKNSAELNGILDKLNDTPTWFDVIKERKELASLGGGCHQKIGSAFKSFTFGQVHSLKGEGPNGDSFSNFELVDNKLESESCPVKSQIFPNDISELQFFTRKELKIAKPAHNAFYLISRSDAWPNHWSANAEDWLWSSGLKTWKTLAKNGFFVNGSFESLGEDMNSLPPVCLRPKCEYFKVSHDMAPEDSFKLIATYQLSNGKVKDLRNKTHIFWMSGSAFDLQLKDDPTLIHRAQHYCGPGHTFNHLKKHIAPERLHLELGFEAWKKRFF